MFRKRPFMVISDMNGKALDIKGGSSNPGTEVIMWQRKNDRSLNQQWYLDQTGCIRSMLNDFAPEANGKGDRFRMQPFRGIPRQQWTFQGNRIVNKVLPGECLDIERAENRDEAHVIAWNYKGSSNQHWRLEYV